MSIVLFIYNVSFPEGKCSNFQDFIDDPTRVLTKLEVKWHTFIVIRPRIAFKAFLHELIESETLALPVAFTG